MDRLLGQGRWGFVRFRPEPSDMLKGIGVMVGRGKADLFRGRCPPFSWGVPGKAGCSVRVPNWPVSPCCRSGATGGDAPEFRRAMTVIYGQCESGSLAGTDFGRD